MLVTKSLEGGGDTDDEEAGDISEGAPIDILGDGGPAKAPAESDNTTINEIEFKFNFKTNWIIFRLVYFTMASLSFSSLDLYEVRRRVQDKCRRKRQEELDKRKKERKRKVEERRLELGKKEAAEKAEKKKAAEEAKSRAESLRRKQRKERREEEAAYQRERMKLRAFQRSYGVNIPNTPPPRKIVLQANTLPSALGAKDPLAEDVNFA